VTINVVKVQDNLGAVGWSLSPAEMLSINKVPKSLSKTYSDYTG